MPSWFASNNGRQTIEAGNKESKTVCKVRHLMSRAPAGIALQVSFTTFANNFVRFAAEWLGPRVERPRRRFWEMLGSVKGLTRIAAKSPAYLQGNPTSRSIQFAHRSSLPEVVIHLGGFSARQLALKVGRPIRISSPWTICLLITQNVGVTCLHIFVHIRLRLAVYLEAVEDDLQTVIETGDVVDDE